MKTLLSCARHALVAAQAIARDLRLLNHTHVDHVTDETQSDNVKDLLHTHFAEGFGQIAYFQHPDTPSTVTPLAHSHSLPLHAGTVWQEASICLHEARIRLSHGPVPQDDCVEHIVAAPEAACGNCMAAGRLPHTHVGDTHVGDTHVGDTHAGDTYIPLHGAGGQDLQEGVGQGGVAAGVRRASSINWPPKSRC